MSLPDRGASAPELAPTLEAASRDGDARLAAIGVVVVTYNSAAVLADCLSSVRAGCDGVGLVSVVLADNDSADDTVERAAAFDGARVVQLGHNAGYAAGVNAAIAALPLTELDAVLVLNPDIRLRPGSVARLAADLSRSGIGIAVPRLVNPDGSLQVSLRRPPTIIRALAEALLGGDRAGRIGNLGELITAPVHYETGREFAWATGAAMLIARATIEQIGDWDESFLLYGEEVDYALRAKDRGFGLWYDPDAVAEHIGGELGSSPFLYALMTVNRVRVYRRWHGRISSAAYHAVVLFGEVLRAAAGRSTSRAAAASLLFPARRPVELP